MLYKAGAKPSQHKLQPTHSLKPVAWCSLRRELVVSVPWTSLALRCVLSTPDTVCSPRAASAVHTKRLVTAATVPRKSKSNAVTCRRMHAAASALALAMPQPRA